jgi:hypothetical protein
LIHQEKRDGRKVNLADSEREKREKKMREYRVSLSLSLGLVFPDMAGYQLHNRQDMLGN